jgi:hypothetical protein
MILEGVVTTLDSSGVVNIAPMGPSVADTGVGPRFVLRPFRTARTYHNLVAHGEGVLHVTDDVLLIARAALGPGAPVPEMLPASQVRGSILAGACRYYEFRVTARDELGDRVTFEAEVVAQGRLRDFFGFNRAKHAVLEAAILATRTALLPRAEIEAEFRRLAVIVRKTGGAQEHAAFELLTQHIQQADSGSEQR